MKQIFCASFARFLGSIGIIFLISCSTQINNPTGPTGNHNATVHVTNYSAYPVSYLYSRPAGTSTWPDEYLGSGYLDSGSTFDISIAPGTYDFKAKQYSTSDTARITSITLSSSQLYNWTLTNASFTSQPGTAQVTIYNNSSLSIYYVHSKISGTTAWSTDLLSTVGTISASGSYTINLPAPASYDLMVNHSSHADSAFKSLYIADGGTYTWTVNDADFASGGSPATVHVVNNSTYSISYLYSRSAGGSTWPTEYLGTSYVTTGGSYDISITPGTYDFKARRSTASDTARITSITLTSGQTYTWTLTDANFGVSSNGTVRIQDNSTYSIYYFYYRQNGTTAWSINQLSGSISVGSYKDFTVPAGLMDLKATQSSTGDTCVAIGVTVPASGTYTWALTDANFAGATGTADITIINSSSSNIFYVHSRVHGTTAWSTDYLGSATTLDIDSSYILSLTAPGTYDIMVNTSQHMDSAISLNQTVSANGSYTWTVNDNSLYGSSSTTRTITINNSSSYSIYYLRKRPVGTTIWSQDFLGANTIPAGTSYAITSTPRTLDIQLESEYGDTLNYLNQSVMSSNITITVTTW